MKAHIKGMLMPDWYLVTCREAVVDNNSLSLMWTVNTGKYAWRNIFETYNLTDYGLNMLLHTCSYLNVVAYEPDHAQFTEQFIGLQAEVKVDVLLQGRTKKNVIIAHKLPTVEAEFDVLKPKTDDYYFHTKKERKLPTDG